MRVLCPFCRTENIFPDTATGSLVCGRCKKGISASVSENAAALVQNIMEAKKKQVRIFEDELRKTNPSMSKEETACYFYVKVEMFGIAVLSDKAFLCEAGIETVKASQINNELFYLFVFAFDMAYHKVFKNHLRGFFSKNLIALRSEAMAATTGNPALGAEIVRCYAKRAEEYFEAFQMQMETRNPIPGVGFRTLLHIKGTSFSDMIKVIPSSSSPSDGVGVMEAFQMDFRFANAVEKFREMLCDCKKLSYLSEGCQA